jgi:hypothetical protein
MGFFITLVASGTISIYRFVEKTHERQDNSAGVINGIKREFFDIPAVQIFRDHLIFRQTTCDYTHRS